VHPTENRYLTAREAAVIQSFPNDFKFIGNRTAVWRQIGNAVPPRLGMALGLALRAMYKKALAHPENIRRQNGRQHLKAIRGKAFRYMEKDGAPDSATLNP
ncbi:MAG: DNA cytosine methyltransferase, partial [Bacteriovoracaceae bacterium]|nr:DNA cytosine methyltransferase [Bacteriovoracaceae bacterium]